MSKKTIKPRYLEPGTAIGIIAVASPVPKDRFDAALAYIQQCGFKTKVALDPSVSYGKTTHLFSSASAQDRARALTELFEDPEVGAIVTARGAYGSMELTPYLDLPRLAKNPKLVVGFSDVTALLVALTDKTGIRTVHGPSIDSAFSKAATNSEARTSAETLIKLLKGELNNPFGETVLTHRFGARSARGILLGGNLSILTSLLGTAWEPSFRGRILVLEEISERPYRIHRMLLQLKLAGKFNGLGGVLLGSFRDCEHPQQQGPTLNQVLADIFEDLKVPVWSGLAIGHEDLNLPIFLGAEARISDNKLEFEN